MREREREREREGWGNERQTRRYDCKIKNLLECPIYLLQIMYMLICHIILLVGVHI